MVEILLGDCSPLLNGPALVSSQRGMSAKVTDVMRARTRRRTAHRRNSSPAVTAAGLEFGVASAEHAAFRKAGLLAMPPSRGSAENVDDVTAAQDCVDWIAIQSANCGRQSDCRAV